MFFHCIETMLFFKLAPSKSLIKTVRKDIKRYKDRISILLAFNMSGTIKLSPASIGKIKNSRPLKNLTLLSLVSSFRVMTHG